MSEGDLLKIITEEKREEVRKRAEQATGHKLFPKKIDKIGLYTRTHYYLSSSLEIGRYMDKHISGCEDEEVGAIFESDSDSYVVCTTNHGVGKGEPYIFRDQEIYEIVEEIND